jgi:hypothetical protein
MLEAIGDAVEEADLVKKLPGANTRSRLRHKVVAITSFSQPYTMRQGLPRERRSAPFTACPKIPYGYNFDRT